MESQKQWQKFILSGKVSDYISYVNAKKAEFINGGKADAHYNGCPCNKGNECRGTRPTDYCNKP